MHAGMPWPWLRAHTRLPWPIDNVHSSRDDNFVPSHFYPCGFSLPYKGGGAGMWRDFSPASQDGTGMGLDFLDPTSPDPPPRPAGIDKG